MATDDEHEIFVDNIIAISKKKEGDNMIVSCGEMISRAENCKDPGKMMLFVNKVFMSLYLNDLSLDRNGDGIKKK